jgi:hypothetical protein
MKIIVKKSCCDRFKDALPEMRSGIMRLLLWNFASGL